MAGSGPVKVDAFASEPHYLRHLIPVWNQLPDEVRGSFMGFKSLQPFFDAAGLEMRTPDPDPRNAILVAGMRDFKMMRRAGKKILMEHGVGQTYIDGEAVANPSYAGGPHREGIDLFLCPNAQVKGANEYTNPSTPSEVIGVPAMDYWHHRMKHPALATMREAMTISFHWSPRSGVPEMGSALGHYARVLKIVHEHYVGNLHGHAHPRVTDQAHRIYRASGIPHVPLADVLGKSVLHICDNSSVLYEFASLGLPVVVLNAPYMRREVQHGLRFWEFADVGVNCDDPDDLIDAIDMALTDPIGVRERREEITDWLFPYRGHAALRAASVVRQYVDQWSH